jgi:hypothetical protein
MSLPGLSLLLASAMLLVAPSARARGPLGHSVVAELAQRRLSPAAEREVERLLAPEHTTRLADVANWPDQIRNDPAQQALWKRTSRWHYINFSSDRCRYVAPRDCPRGECVVATLARVARVLGDRSQPDAVRREALKFVVHLVGDVHQPLHAGYRPDLGGNRYQVQFEGRGSNLHKVWDSGLLNTRRLRWREYANLLDARPPPTLPPAIAPLDDPYAQWAGESCRLTAAMDFYPSRRRIGSAYVDRNLPLAERRLREAARRLAEVLNSHLGEVVTQHAHKH